MSGKKREFKLNIWLVVIFGIIFLLSAVSIFFNSSLTYLMHLKPNVSNIENNSLEVHFLDTGEGDAILVRLPNDKTMIIDSGIVSRRGEIVSYIDKVFFNKQDKIFDYAVLTHSDIDHSGNMAYILDNYTVKNFYRPKIYSVECDTNYSSQDLAIDDENYDSILNKTAELKINTIFIERGAETNAIKDYVKFLTPDKDFYDDENLYSPIMLLSYQGKGVLLTGDATIENEIEVINHMYDIEVDVLKLAHHGSKTSTSREFLEFTSPDYAIISYGENTSGHPHSEVIDRIKNYNMNLYNNTFSTYEDNNIICHISNNEINFTFVDNINSYVFVDYYFIAIGIMGICLIVVFFPRYKKDKE